MDEVMLVLECSNGVTLIAERGDIVIKTKGREEKMELSTIKAVEIQESAGLATGKITLRQAADGMTYGVGRAFSFKKRDLALAYKIRDYIENAGFRSFTAGKEERPAPAAEALRELEYLVERGILSEEEFAAKKRSLLER